MVVTIDTAPGRGPRVVPEPEATKNFLIPLYTFDPRTVEGLDYRAQETIDSKRRGSMLAKIIMKRIEEHSGKELGSFFHPTTGYDGLGHEIKRDPRGEQYTFLSTLASSLEDTDIHQERFLRATEALRGQAEVPPQNTEALERFIYRIYQDQTQIFLAPESPEEVRLRKLVWDGGNIQKGELFHLATEVIRESSKRRLGQAMSQLINGLNWERDHQSGLHLPFEHDKQALFIDADVIRQGSNELVSLRLLRNALNRAEELGIDLDETVTFQGEQSRRQEYLAKTRVAPVVPVKEVVTDLHAPVAPAQPLSEPVVAEAAPAPAAQKPNPVTPHAEVVAKPEPAPKQTPPPASAAPKPAPAPVEAAPRPFVERPTGPRLVDISLNQARQTLDMVMNEMAGAKLGETVTFRMPPQVLLENIRGGQYQLTIPQRNEKGEQIRAIGGKQCTITVNNPGIAQINHGELQIHNTSATIFIKEAQLRPFKKDVILQPTINGALTQLGETVVVKPNSIMLTGDLGPALIEGFVRGLLTQQVANYGNKLLPTINEQLQNLQAQERARGKLTYEAQLTGININSDGTIDLKAQRTR